MSVISCAIGLVLVVLCAAADGEALSVPGGQEGPRAEPSPTQQLVAVNGTELFVNRMGAGEPIVIVHGGPVLEHGYLLPHLEPLADDYELIFYDQRLSGRSAGTADPESIRVSTFVDDIEALRETLSLDRIHLMGHSWGGMLAMRYAIRYPDNLRSLILLDSMAASTGLWRAEEAALAERISPQAAAELTAFQQSEGIRQRRPEAIALMLRMAFRTQFTDPAKIDLLQIYVPADYAARSEQFGAMGADLAAFDFHDDLTGMTAPTLVLYGADEPGGALGGEAIAAAIPGAELELIPAAGHFPFIENPTAFMERVRSFLGQVPSPPW